MTLTPEQIEELAILEQAAASSAIALDLFKLALFKQSGPLLQSAREVVELRKALADARDSARHWEGQCVRMLGSFNKHRDALEALIGAADGVVLEYESAPGALQAVVDDARATLRAGYRHASDCATHNAPALPVGPCDCAAAENMELLGIVAEALGSFRCTQRVDEYPVDHWSHRARAALKRGEP